MLTPVMRDVGGAEAFETNIRLNCLLDERQVLNELRPWVNDGVIRSYSLDGLSMNPRCEVVRQKSHFSVLRLHAPPVVLGGLHAGHKISLEGY